MNHKYIWTFILTGLLTLPAFGGYLSPEKAVTMIKNNKAILVDIRERSELSSGLAKPALWIPNSSFQKKGAEWVAFQKRISTDKSIPVIFYCGSGRRARTIVTYLKSLGHKAYNMGGFRDWKKAGLAIKRK